MANTTLNKEEAHEHLNDSQKNSPSKIVYHEDGSFSWKHAADPTVASIAAKGRPCNMDEIREFLKSEGIIPGRLTRSSNFSPFLSNLVLEGKLVRVNRGIYQARKKKSCDPDIFFGLVDILSDCAHAIACSKKRFRLGEIYEEFLEFCHEQGINHELLTLEEIHQLLRSGKVEEVIPISKKANSKQPLFKIKQ